MCIYKVFCIGFSNILIKQTAFVMCLRLGKPLELLYFYYRREIYLKPFLLILSTKTECW